MKTICLLVVLFCMHNALAQAVPVGVIPFRVENNCMYIYCKVNDTDSLKFLFDTGANGSVINSQSGKVSLPVSGESLNTGSNGNNVVEQSIGNRVQFGGIERTNASFTLIAFGTDRFDGVFGTDLMKGNILEIDYHRLEIRLYNENDRDIDLKGYEKMTLHMVDDYPAVESRFYVNGKRYKGLFGLDSGADDALTIAAPFAKASQLSGNMEQIAAASFQGSDGSIYEMPIVRCPAIRLGENYLYRIPAALSNATEGIDATEKMAGFFGNNFLKRFNILIDFRKNAIYFKLNDNLYTPF